MDLLKISVEAADANFIDESRFLLITEGGLVLWDLIKPAPLVTFKLGGLGANIGPGWVILRNYELEGTSNFRANPDKSGIVGIFPEVDNSMFNMVNPLASRKGLVIPVSTLLKEISDDNHRFAEWEDWNPCVTVLDLPKYYDLYVFHTHVLCLYPSNFKPLKYYIFDFAPHTAGSKLNAAARGALPDWVKSLSGPWTLPVTFSGEIGSFWGEYFPTENGILAINVSPISWSKSVLDF